jgi:TPR repeat protein
VKWFLKAAEQRHNDAMQNLAQCCRHGFGVEQDETEADRWDELAEAAAEHEEEHDDDDEDI